MAVRRPRAPSAPPPALLLVLAALLAGCSGEPLQAPEDNDVAPVDAQPPPTRARQAPVTSEAPPTLRMSDCSGWVLYATVAGARPSPRTPSGWEEDPPQDVAAVDLWALDCARVSVGPYERPLRMLVEATTSFVAPGRCLEVASDTVFGVLNSLWMEDAEVAALLASTFGLEAFVRPLTVDVSQVGGAGAATWSWGLEGQPESRIAVLGGVLEARHPTADWRLFWAKGSGVGQLDLDPGVQVAATGLPAAGTMQPPMLLHDDGRPFAAAASPFTGGNAEGRFTLYEDLACERPAE